MKEAYSAATAYPQDAYANGKLGMILHAHSDLDQRAELCYRRAHLLDPDSFRWAYYLGLVLAGEGKYDEAVVVLRQALRLSPEYLPAQLKLGESLLALAQWEEAGEVYAVILQTRPNSAEAHYGLGRVRAARKDLNGAAESFRKACEIFPYYGAAHYALALVYRDLGRTDQSREELALFERKRASAPREEDQLWDEIRAAYQGGDSRVAQATQLGRQGKFDEAVAAYQYALQSDPALFEAHVNLILLYGRLQKFDKAEEHYRAAIGIHPNYPESHYNYGVLLAEQGRYGEAEEAFRKVVEINPYHAEAHYYLGDLLQRQGQLDEAVAEFRKAIENGPDFAQAHFNLGRLLVNQKNHAEGIQHLLKSLNTKDEVRKPSYLYAVGAAYARAGDRGKALRYLRQARDLAAVVQQSTLVDSIEGDLRILEGGGNSQ